MFSKKRSDTYLRVVYQGNLRIRCCGTCCKRWYFAFDTLECPRPVPIDAVVYQNGNIDIIRSASIEGYCGGVPPGEVRVGFYVGNCKGFDNVENHTSWNSVSRIIVEEVEPPEI